MKLYSVALLTLCSALPTNVSAKQTITIPPGHDIHIVIDATQAPLGQRWKIAAWGQRDGVQLPVPGGWTPPTQGPRWSQLIYQEQTSYSGVVTHKELNWPRHNHPLILEFEGWANRNGEYPSLDQITTADNNHTVIAFDRVQDSDALNNSHHYADMHMDIIYSPPLNTAAKSVKMPHGRPKRTKR